ncbi:MAG: hypothetical protein ABI377_06570, partial [Devosia sp.]
ISRLESTEYGKASVQTLLDIASANDVALVVRFVSYPEFLAQTSDMSPQALQPETIHESLAKPMESATTSGPYAGDWYIRFRDQAAPQLAQLTSNVHGVVPINGLKPF